MLSQKEAVYQVVCQVTGFNGEGQVSLTSQQKSQIQSILIEGFKNKSIQLEKVYNDTELKSYVIGLLNNWLRKDTRLNGGVKYTAKNPGSRTGSGDAQLIALKALLSTMTDPNERNEVQGYIDARIKELQPKQDINYNVLPEALRNKFTK